MGCGRSRMKVVDRAGDPGDRADQHVREVHGVAEQVAGDPVATLFELEAPGVEPQRVGAVHGEEAAPVVGDRTQLAGRDELTRVLHQRRPAVVVAHAADHAGGAGCTGGMEHVRGRPADRLLAEHRLACAGHRGHELSVQHVGRRDPDGVDVGVLHHGPPVHRAALEPERADGILDAGRQGVAAGDEPRLIGAFLKQHRDPRQRPAVRLAQPSEADHPDSDADPRVHAGIASNSSMTSAS